MATIRHVDYKDRSWTPQPAAERFFGTILDEALKANPAVAAFAERLLATTAVRLRDIVDHVTLRDTTRFQMLSANGWRDRGDGVLVNPLGEFPEVLTGSANVVWLRVEHVRHFLRTLGLDAPIEGDVHGPLQRSLCFPGTVSFGVLSRQGYPGFDVPRLAEPTIRLARLHHQQLLARRRQFDTVEQGLTNTETLVDSAVRDARRDAARRNSKTRPASAGRTSITTPMMVRAATTVTRSGSSRSSGTSCARCSTPAS
jgi:hypothetical protein